MHQMRTVVVEFILRKEFFALGKTQLCIVIPQNIAVAEFLTMAERSIYAVEAMALLSDIKTK